MCTATYPYLTGHNPPQKRNPAALIRRLNVLAPIVVLLTMFGNGGLFLLTYSLSDAVWCSCGEWSTGTALLQASVCARGLKLGIIHNLSNVCRWQANCLLCAQVRRPLSAPKMSTSWTLRRLPARTCHTRAALGRAARVQASQNTHNPSGC